MKDKEEERHTILTMGVARTALQIRRSWNLEGVLMAMILYLSKKWRAMSAMLDPDTTTFTPASAIPLIIWKEKEE